MNIIQLLLVLAAICIAFMVANYIIGHLLPENFRSIAYVLLYVLAGIIAIAVLLHFAGVNVGGLGTRPLH